MTDTRHDLATSATSVFELPVLALFGGFLLFVAERYLAFVFLLEASNEGSWYAFHAIVLLFGKPPFSAWDVLLGFDYQSLDHPLDMFVQPMSALRFTLQWLHLLANWYVLYWLAKALQRRAIALLLIIVGAAAALAYFAMPLTRHLRPQDAPMPGRVELPAELPAELAD